MRAIRHSRSVAACIAAMLVLTACDNATSGESVHPTEAPASGQPTSSSSPSGPPESVTPTAPAATDPPPPPTDASASEPPATEAPSTGSGSAAACTGSDANRDFYADAAAALDWAVYCPVLPSGWFVNTGEYTLRDGGRLTIEYKGPGGARFALDESASCVTAQGCPPSGTEVGPAEVGDRNGMLMALDDGGFAAYATDGTGAWLATGTGLDQDLFTRLAADLVEVSD
jgi:hypothetical protein